MFWKTFHLILIHFYFLYSMLWGMFFKNSVKKKKKKELFQIFDWSIVFFDQSKFLLKILVSLCLVRLIEPVFRLIEHRESSFLNMDLDFFKRAFSKVFSSSLSLSLSLSDLDLAPPQIFIVFNPFFCKVSLSKHR